jgi:hypothetical protein
VLQVEDVEAEAVGVLRGGAALGVDDRDRATEPRGDTQRREGLAGPGGAEQRGAELGGVGETRRA